MKNDVECQFKFILGLSVLIFFVFGFVMQGCHYFRLSHEEAFLKILDHEKKLVQKYYHKGYLAYLKDNHSDLAQNIQEKNKHVVAMNEAYIKMDRQQKNEYVETWRQHFTEAWQAYEQDFLKLKSSFIPKDEVEKTEIQIWEAQWQAVMQEVGVMSLEPPLFFVTGD